MNVGTASALLFAVLTSVIAPSAMAKNVSIGIYALIDDVTFEPIHARPERVRICGVFVVPSRMSSGEYEAPRPGCLSFSIPAGRESQSQREWKELKEEAGTGHVVGFGRYWRRNPNDPAPNGYRSLEVNVYDKTEAREIESYPIPRAEGIAREGDKHEQDSDFNKIAAQLKNAARSLVSPLRGHAAERPE